MILDEESVLNSSNHRTRFVVRAERLKGRNKGDFETGIELALQRILADPEFVFRTEVEPANAKPGQVYRISDMELASRLSYFLWSTSPDDELINLATQGRLKNPSVLEQQTRRMLADPRSHQLAVNFAGQWWQLRNLQSKAPTTQTFPDFDDNLRQAFRTEAEMFFESIMREDRSLIDLLNADYTFVNERLARHYGIPNVYGSHFMDPIGFTLENFNAVGAWRTREGGQGGDVIDPSGELSDGTKIDGPSSLTRALVKYSPQFVRTVTEKLLIYGLGRGAGYSDMPVVRSVVRDAARTNYKFSSLIVGIVKSAPFQQNMKVQDNVASR